MVCFQTKNPNLGQFWRALCRLESVYNVLWPFGIFYRDLGYFVTILYILYSFGTFSGFGIMYQEKSGNPVKNSNSTGLKKHYIPS
jgi:hypothetical protein